ncbi:hypothetical protein G3I60_41165 [Streptomyces sp. SID13666]|nr:hypothetical protein [Streptomyces sp. SID13666]NEA76838.1 hypothetical protein [Streptomyces sp. SID13588]
MRADAVLRAQEAGLPLPLLMLEMDMGTEPVQGVADKLAAYAACYRRRVNDPATPGTWPSRRTGETTTVPYWQTHRHSFRPAAVPRAGPAARVPRLHRQRWLVRVPVARRQLGPHPERHQPVPTCRPTRRPRAGAPGTSPTAPASLRLPGRADRRSPTAPTSTAPADWPARP